MAKTKADLVRDEVNGYHPSIFFEPYIRYSKQTLVELKKKKVKRNDKNRNNRNTEKKQQFSI